MTLSNHITGNILHMNMILLPFAIDPFGQFGLILQHFLFDTPTSNKLIFPPSHPNAQIMYTRIMTFPSPKGILKLANHNWCSN